MWEKRLGGLLVTGFLYNAPDRHNQSPPQLLLLKETGRKQHKIPGDVLFQLLLLLVDLICKSARFCDYRCSSSEIPPFPT